MLYVRSVYICLQGSGRCVCAPWPLACGMARRLLDTVARSHGGIRGLTPQSPALAYGSPADPVPARLVRERLLSHAHHDTMLCMVCAQGNVDVRVARIFNTFGPRMNPSDGRVVSNFIVQVKLLRAPLPSSSVAACCFLARPLASLSCTQAQAVATQACASDVNARRASALAYGSPTDPLRQRPRSFFWSKVEGAECTPRTPPCYPHAPAAFLRPPALRVAGRDAGSA